MFMYCSFFSKCLLHAPKRQMHSFQAYFYICPCVPTEFLKREVILGLNKSEQLQAPLNNKSEHLAVLSEFWDRGWSIIHGSQASPGSRSQFWFSVRSPLSYFPTRCAQLPLQCEIYTLFILFFFFSFAEIGKDSSLRTAQERRIDISMDSSQHHTIHRKQDTPSETAINSHQKN